MDIKEFIQRYENSEVDIYPAKFDRRAWYVTKDEDGKLWGIFANYDPEFGYGSISSEDLKWEQPKRLEPIYGIVDFKRM